MPGLPRNKVPERVRRGICSGGKERRGYVSATFMFEKAPLRKLAHQLLEGRPHRLRDSERAARNLCSVRNGHRRQTAREQRGRELIARRERGLECGAPAQGEHLVERPLRRVAQTV